MSETNTKDEPAFPVVEAMVIDGRGVEVIHRTQGITKLDFFAAHALAGFIAAYPGDTARGLARLAYDTADAVLAESQRRAGK